MNADRAQLRVLRRLGGGEARLVPTKEGWCVHPRGDRRTRALARCDEAVFRDMRARGSVEPDPEALTTWRLSDAGRAQLARSEAAPEEAFASQHQARETQAREGADGARDWVRVNGAESPLAWLYRRRGPDGERFISDREFAAGERLRADFHRSTLAPRVTADWTAPPRGSTARGPSRSSLEGPASRLAARERVLAALGAVGPDLRCLVEAACLEERALDIIERERKWPKRSCKLVLKLALSRLADHYGAPPD